LFGIIHPWIMGHDDETVCRSPNRELGFFACSEPRDNPRLNGNKAVIADVSETIEEAKGHSPAREGWASPNQRRVIG